MGFPLGRPLGKPGDPEFQRRVLDHALSLLEAEGPVLDRFPEEIEDEGDVPLACPIPPRHDEGLHPAVDEARALRSAYDRAVSETGRTLVGRVTDADGIPAAVEAFVRIAEGTA